MCFFALDPLFSLVPVIMSLQSKSIRPLATLSAKAAETTTTATVTATVSGSAAGKGEPGRSAPG